VEALPETHQESRELGRHLESVLVLPEFDGEIEIGVEVELQDGRHLGSEKSEFRQLLLNCCLVGLVVGYACTGFSINKEILMTSPN
jgi:hypothetical protein